MIPSRNRKIAEELQRLKHERQRILETSGAPEQLQQLERRREQLYRNLKRQPLAPAAVGFGAVLLLIMLLGFGTLLQGGLTGYVVSEPGALTQQVNLTFTESTNLTLNISSTTQLLLSGELIDGEVDLWLLVGGERYHIHTDMVEEPFYTVKPEKSSYARDQQVLVSVTPRESAHTLWLVSDEGRQLFTPGDILEPGQYTIEALFDDAGTIEKAAASFIVRNDTNRSRDKLFSPGERIIFTDVCDETCTLAAEALQHTLLVELSEGATLHITEITSSRQQENTPPVQWVTLPNITLGVNESTTLKLQNYFVDPDGEELFYDAMTTWNVRMEIEESSLTITGINEGSAESLLFVSDAASLVESERFTITVTNNQTNSTRELKQRLPSLKQEILDSLAKEGKSRILVKADPAQLADLEIKEVAGGYFSIEADAAALEQLERNGIGTAALLDRPVSLLLGESSALIRADVVQQSHSRTGAGATLCLIDTGADPEVINYTRGFDFANNDTDPTDDHGHGTEVASVVQHLAPGAELIIVKVLNASGEGYESNVMEGIAYCDAQNASIISLSIGSGSYSSLCDQNPLAAVANDAASYVVAAAGNDGATTLKAPACGQNVTAVAATTKDDQLWAGSSLNNVTALLAPGVHITLQTLGGASLSRTGTSIAAPHVAAVVTLLLENTSLEPEAIEYHLRATGRVIEINGRNYSRVDALNALLNNVTNTPAEFYSSAPEDDGSDNATEITTLAFTGGGAWYNNSWLNRRTINVTNVGSTNLTNFPILLNITYDSDMQADYDDLRFVNGTCGDASAAELYYDMDNYTSSSAFVWVKIPTFEPGSNSLCMYYNNSAASSGEDPAQVWDAFSGVYHLEEGGTGTRADATVHERNGSPVGYDNNEAAAGILGGADKLNGDGTEFLNLTNDLSVFMNASVGTASAWVYYEGTSPSISNAWNGISPFGDAGGYFGAFRGTISSQDRVWFYSWDGNEDRFGATYSTGEWVYLTWVHDGGTVYGYVNGDLAGSVASGDIEVVAGDMVIQVNYNDNSPTNTTIDEVRYSNVSMTADWINQSYQMVINQSGLVTNGSEETFGQVCSASGNWTINQSVDCLGKAIVVDSLNITDGGSLTFVGGSITVAGRTIVDASSSFTLQDSKNTLWQNGNLLISGNFTLDNSTLRMNVSTDGEFGIRVLSGGQMIIQSSSNVTNGETANVGYTWKVDSGASFDMSNSKASWYGMAADANGENNSLWILATSVSITNNTLEQGLRAGGTAMRSLALEYPSDTTSDSVIANNTIHQPNNNSRAITVNRAWNVSVDGNIINISGELGPSYGLLLEDFNNGTVDQNNLTISGTDTYGVLIEGGENNSIDRNILSSTAGTAIHFNSSGESNNITRNNITLAATSTGNGIHIASLSSTLVESNIIGQNTTTSTGYAISLGTNANSTTIRENSINVTNTGGSGILLSAAHNNTLDNNTFLATTGALPVIRIDSAASGNLLTQSSITHQGTGYGIQTLGQATDNTYEYNTLLTENETFSITLGENHTIRHNNITINASASNKSGIVLTETANSTILNNTITTTNHSPATGIHGIFLNTNADNITIANSTITTEPDAARAIYVYDSDEAIISENTLETTADHADANGILIHNNSHNATVENNNVTTAGGSAILLQSGSWGGILTNNTLTTTGTTAYALVLSDNISRTVVQNSTLMTSGASAHVVRVENAVINNSFKKNILNSSSTYLILTRTGSYGNTFVSTTYQSGHTDDIQIEDTSNLTLINTTQNTSRITFSSATTAAIDVRWFVDVFVNESNSSAVPGANVTIENGFSTLVANETTGSTGFITRQNFSEYWKNSTVEIYYSNYTVNASHSNYTGTFSESFNLTASSQRSFTFSSDNVCGYLNTDKTLNWHVVADSNADCFIFNASNIVLDCQGYNITGSGYNGSVVTVGINMSGHENNTVIDCYPDTFAYGFHLRNTSGNKIINISSTKSNLAYEVVARDSNNNNFTNVGFTAEILYQNVSKSVHKNLTGAILLQNASFGNNFTDLTLTSAGSNAIGIITNGSTNNRFVNFSATQSFNAPIIAITGSPLDNYFDCGGGTLQATGLGSQHGFSGATSSTIKNCIIRDVRRGITAGTRINMSNVTIRNVTDGFYATTESNFTLVRVYNASASGASLEIGNTGNNFTDIIITTYSSGDGFDIDAGNNYIDCQGGSITGTDSAAAEGISIGQADNRVTVKNCEISDFGYGIDVFRSGKHTFSNITLISNIDGIYTRNMSHSQFTGITAINNTDNGINLATYVVDLTPYPTSDNNFTKIRVSGGSHTSFGIDESNSVHRNNRYIDIEINLTGIAKGMSMSGVNTYVDCQGGIIDGDDSANSDGFYKMTASSNTTLRNCTFTDFANGIRFTAGDSGTLLENNISSSTTGIYLASGVSSLAITNNSFCGSSTVDAQDLGSNTWSGNSCDTWYDNAVCTLDCSGNYYPVAQNVTITPTVAYDADDLNCSFNITDRDSTTLSVNVTWFRNGVENLTYTLNVTNSSINSTLLGAGNTSVSDSWICEVRPYDGSIYGRAVNSSATTINQDCGTITANTTMTRNLSSPGSTCFTIGAANIVLDCAGYTMTGDESSATYGVHNDGYDNFTVKDCSIDRFQSGVFFQNVNRPNVSNIAISSTPSLGMRLTGVHDGIFSDITATNTTGGGLRFNTKNDRNNFTNFTVFGTNTSAYGIRTLGPNTRSDNRFTGLTIKDVTTIGIFQHSGNNDGWTIDCQGGTISGDKSAGSIGLHILGEPTTVANCTIRDFEVGLDLDSVDSNNFTAITLLSNENGTRFDNTDSNTFTDIIATNNTDYAFNFETGTDQNDFINTQITGAAGGIFMGGSLNTDNNFTGLSINLTGSGTAVYLSNDAPDNNIFNCQDRIIDGDNTSGSIGFRLSEADNTTISNCILTQFSTGILIEGSSVNHTISNLKVNFSETTGINVSSSSSTGSTFTSNYICSSGGYDIADSDSSTWTANFCGSWTGSASCPQSCSGNAYAIVQSVNLTPAQPQSSDDLNCTVNITDADAGDALSVNITWYKDGVAAVTDTINVVNSTLNSSILSSGNTSGGETWVCEARPYDGSDYGTAVNSSARSINTGCGTITADTTLTQNLTSNGTCFFIGASNLVLDGAGFSIRGNTSGYGINNTGGYDNVTIRNFGGILNYTNAINLDGSAIGVTIQNNTIVAANVSSGHGLFLQGDTNTTVFNNTIITSGGSAHGLLIYPGSITNNLTENTIATSGSGSGFYLQGADNTLIVQNTVTTTGGGAGIFATLTADANRFLHNNVTTSTSSLAYGIYIGGSTGITAYNNTINTSTASSYGIWVTSTAADANVTGNTVTTSGSAGYAILVDGADDAVVIHNTLSTTGGAIGILLQSSAHRNVIQENTVTTSTSSFASAIFLVSSDNNTVYNNTVTTSTSDSNGVRLQGGANNNITQNIINATGTHALFLTTDPTYNTTFRNNTIHSNPTYGQLFVNTAGINRTTLIDQPITDYTFTGAGGTLTVRDSTFGEITFLEQVNGSGTNLSGDIIILSNHAEVDSSGKPGLNRSANITFYGLSTSYLNPYIARNNATCPASICTNLTSLNAGTVIINVTGWTNYSIQEGNENPTIVDIENISSQSITEAGESLVTFWVLARDLNGVAEINTSTLNATFTRTGEDRRTNTSCTFASNYNTTTANFTCTIGIWYWDGAGVWAVNATMTDTHGGISAPYNESFTLMETTAMVMSPTAATWPSLSLTATNQSSNNDPIVINNTGNKDIADEYINVTGYDLAGTTTATQLIYAANFTVHTIDACNGTAMANATSLNITGATLPAGNNSAGQGQEQLYFCLLGMSADLSAQTYDTSKHGEWVIQVS